MLALKIVAEVLQNMAGWLLKTTLADLQGRKEEAVASTVCG